MNIYIANLDSQIDNDGLRDLFTPFGEVKSAEVAEDVFTGGSRGFGYVQMEEEQGRKAITRLHKSVLHTLTLTVEEAPAPKEYRGSYKVGDGAMRFSKPKKRR